jgi:hypothetical protein
MAARLLAIVIVSASIGGAAFAEVSSVPVPLTTPSTNGHSPQMPYQNAAPRTPLFAVVGTHVLSGEARQPRLNPEGVILLSDAAQPQFTCKGKYREDPKIGGRVKLACSDGTTVALEYHGLKTGGAVGATVLGATPVSLCFGMTATRAAQHLVAPSGYSLIPERHQIQMKKTGV